MDQPLSLEKLLEGLQVADEQGLNKEASDAAGSESAADQLQNLLTKQASEVNGETPNMSKENALGTSIAEAILAQIGGMNKQAENMVQADLDQMVADDERRDQATPREGKTVTEVAKALLERGVAEGGVQEAGFDEVAAEGKEQYEGTPVASDLSKEASEAIHALIGEGVAFDEAVELVKQASDILSVELEKAAAFDALIAEGVDFDDAAYLVKAASEQLFGYDEEEYTDIEKSAAVAQLVSEGIDFEEAAELVKQASALTVVKKAVPALIPGKKGLSTAAKAAIAGTAAAGAAGAGAYAYNRKKKAQ